MYKFNQFNTVKSPKNLKQGPKQGNQFFCAGYLKKFPITPVGFLFITEPGNMTILL